MVVHWKGKVLIGNPTVYKVFNLSFSFDITKDFRAQTNRLHLISYYISIVTSHIFMYDDQQNKQMIFLENLVVRVLEASHLKTLAQLRRRTSGDLTPRIATSVNILQLH